MDTRFDTFIQFRSPFSSRPSMPDSMNHACNSVPRNEVNTDGRRTRTGNYVGSARIHNTNEVSRSTALHEVRAMNVSKGVTIGDHFTALARQLRGNTRLGENSAMKYFRPLNRARERSSREIFVATYRSIRGYTCTFNLFAWTYTSIFSFISYSIYRENLNVRQIRSTLRP